MAGSDAFALTSFVISIITFVFNMIWSPFEKARSSQIKLALDLKRKYTLEMQQHLDTMYSYQKKHRQAYLHFPLSEHATSLSLLSGFSPFCECRYPPFETRRVPQTPFRTPQLM